MSETSSSPALSAQATSRRTDDGGWAMSASVRSRNPGGARPGVVPAPNHLATQPGCPVPAPRACRTSLAGVPRRTRPLGPLATGLASEPPSTSAVSSVEWSSTKITCRGPDSPATGGSAGWRRARTLVPSRDDDRNRGPRRGVGGDRQPHPGSPERAPEEHYVHQMISGTAASHTTGRTLEEGLVSARLWNELRPRGHGDPPASRSPPISCRRGRLPRHLEAVSASRSCQASSNGRAMQTSGG